MALCQHVELLVFLAISPRPTAPSSLPSVCHSGTDWYTRWHPAVQEPAFASSAMAVPTVLWNRVCVRVCCSGGWQDGVRGRGALRCDPCRGSGTYSATGSKSPDASLTFLLIENLVGSTESWVMFWPASTLMGSFNMPLWITAVVYSVILVVCSISYTTSY